MTILFGVYGQLKALEYLTNKATTTENLVYNFFGSNITPAHTDTYSTYSAYIPTGGGYSAITMTGASWGAPTQSTGTSTTTYGSAQVWTFTGALSTNTTIYGYFVTGATNTSSEYFAESFTSFTPANNGDSITLTPTITAT